MGGWIKIYPKLTEWRWYKDGYTVRIFLHLLLTANFKDKPFLSTTVKRGQVLTSVRRLSEDLNIPEKTVRRKLENLKNTGEVVTESTNKWTIITICNYECYQGAMKTDDQTNDQTNDRTDDQQHKNNRIIEDKKETISKEIVKKEVRSSPSKTKEPSPQPPSLKLPYGSPRFIEVWETLKVQPKWKGKTAYALQISLNKLGKYDEAFAIALMEEAIEHNWQGVVFDGTDAKYREWKAGLDSHRKPIDKNDVNALWDR